MFIRECLSRGRSVASRVVRAFCPCQVETPPPAVVEPELPPPPPPPPPEPPVRLVQLDPLKLYWFTNDYYYKTMGEGCKNASLEEHVRRIQKEGFCYLPHPAMAALESTPTDSYRQNPLLYAMCEFSSLLWAAKRPFTYMDLGGFYGHTCLYVADFIRRCGKPTKVYCFEPGRAGELVPYNIQLNGLEDVVTFEPLAVLDHNLPILFQADPEHLDSGSVAFANRSGGEFRIARSTTLPGYLDRKKIEGDLVLKIDIEGFDFRVLRSVVEARPNIHVLGAIELNNMALRNFGSDPAKDVAGLLLQNHVIVLPPSRQFGPMQWVDRPGGMSVAEVIQMIDDRCGYVDLMFAPKSLDGTESLMDKWVRERYCWAHE